MSEPGADAGAERAEETGQRRNRTPSPFARGASGSRGTGREDLAAPASSDAQTPEPPEAAGAPEAEPGLAVERASGADPDAAGERAPDGEPGSAVERAPDAEQDSDGDPGSAVERASGAERDPDAEPAAGSPAAGRVSGLPRRRATIMAVLAAVLVLAVGVAVWSALEAERLRDPGGNVALADEAGTREVADQVSAGLKAIFSYDYNNLERTERAADRVLVEQAVGQYEESFAAASAQAREQRLVRTTTVRSVGVRELAGDEARVLALVDQQTLHTADANRQETTSAALAVVAKRVGGEWKIAALAGL
ncbi:hypothetical protein [Prauserella endophytica]|nr:hypothetical protein [Prauserella endophytica]